MCIICADPNRYYSLYDEIYIVILLPSAEVSIHVLLILDITPKMYIYGKICFFLTSEVSRVKRRLFKCVWSIHGFKTKK